MKKSPLSAGYQAMVDTLRKKGMTSKEIRSIVALRRRYWKLVEKSLLRGEVRKGVEGIVAIAAKDVKRAEKFYREAA